MSLRGPVTHGTKCSDSGRLPQERVSPSEDYNQLIFGFIIFLNNVSYACPLLTRNITVTPPLNKQRKKRVEGRQRRLFSSYLYGSLACFDLSRRIKELKCVSIFRRLLAPGNHRSGEGSQLHTHEMLSVEAPHAESPRILTFFQHCSN